MKKLREIFYMALCSSIGLNSVSAQVPLSNSQLCNYGGGINNEYGAFFDKDRNGEYKGQRMLSTSMVQGGTSNSRVAVRPFLDCVPHAQNTHYGDYSTSVFSQDEIPRGICEVEYTYNNVNSIPTVYTTAHEYRVPLQIKDYTNPFAPPVVKLLKGITDDWAPSPSYSTVSDLGVLNPNNALRDVQYYRFNINSYDDPYPHKDYQRLVGTGVNSAGRSCVTVAAAHIVKLAATLGSYQGWAHLFFDTNDVTDWEEVVKDVYVDESANAVYVCGYAKNPNNPLASKSFLFKSTYYAYTSNTYWNLDWVVYGHSPNSSFKESWNSVLKYKNTIVVTGMDGKYGKLNVTRFDSNGALLQTFTDVTANTDFEAGIKVYEYGAAEIFILGQTIGGSSSTPVVITARLRVSDFTIVAQSRIPLSNSTDLKINDAANTFRIASKALFVTGEVKVSGKNTYYLLKINPTTGTIIWQHLSPQYRSGGNSVAVSINSFGQLSQVLTTGYFQHPLGGGGDDVYQNIYSGAGLRMSDPRSETVADNNTNANVEVYPNPGSGMINYNSNEPVNRVEVYGLDGKKIGLGVNIKGDHSGTIDVTGLTRGIYILRFNNYINVRFSKQ